MTAFVINHGQTSFDYEEKLEKLIIEKLTNFWWCSDDICGPRANRLFKIAWFPEEIFLVIHFSDFVSRTSKLQSWYCLSSDDYLNSTRLTVVILYKGV